MAERFGNWLDHPITGVYVQPSVYAAVTGIESFEPWLQRLENDFTLPLLIEFAKLIPSEWHQDNERALEVLLLELDQRRKRVRELIAITLREESRYFRKAFRPATTLSQVSLQRVHRAGNAM